MGKFGRKLKRGRCLTGKLRYRSPSEAKWAQKRVYETHGKKMDAVFCYQCGAFHLANSGDGK
jgi:hypothetical protein